MSLFLGAFDVVLEEDGHERNKRLAQKCKDLIAVRRRIGSHLGFDLCADPVWDMLLDLYISEKLNRNISISSLSTAANVAPSTARGGITALLTLGWVYRQPDPRDGRRIYIRLTPKARLALEAIFDVQ